MLLGQAVLSFSKQVEVSGLYEFFHLFGKFILPTTFLLIILPEKHTKQFEFLYILAASVLFVDSVLLFTQNKYAPEQLIEHGLKFGLPILYFFRYKLRTKRLIIGLKILVALTFIGHGLFALGWHFVPGSFVQMVQNVFGFTIDQSLTFLKIFGFLDLLMAALLFIPKINKLALVYIVFWGLLTSLARVAAYFNFVTLDDLLSIYLFEMIWRLPHFLIGVVILQLDYFKTQKSTIS